MQVESLGAKQYAFVCVDDFSRCTWIKFVQEKLETFKVYRALCLQLQCEKGRGIIRIRSDHGREFQNSNFNDFCKSEGILHEFYSPLTPQQNEL